MSNKPIVVRPSNLQLAMSCPGQPAMTKDIPWEEPNEAMKRGIKLHDAMALLFSAGPEAWDKIKSNPEISEEEVTILQECVRIGNMLKPAGETRSFTERKLDLKWMGLSNGKVDFYWLSVTHRGLVLVDWKFGGAPTEDPEEHWQTIAYACGLAKEHDPFKLETFENVIIQPSSRGEAFRQHTFTVDQLREQKAPQIIKGVKDAFKPGAPTVAGPHCDSGWCKARDFCEAYKDMKAIKKEAKETAHNAEVLTVTSGVQPVMVTTDQEFKTPVIVIDAAIVKEANDKRELALSMTVTTDGTATAAGKLSKNVRKLHNLIDENRKKVKDPFYQMGVLIDAAARNAMQPLKEAADHIDAQVDQFFKARKEAERKAQRVEEMRRREAEAKAEKARQAEERKRLEVEKKARQAAEAAKAAANAQDEEARKKAEAEYEAKMAEAKKAQEKQAEAERKRLAEQQKADLAAAEQQRIAEEANKKIAGYRQKATADWDIPDLAKVPADWARLILIPDKKAITALIKSGKLTEANTVGWMVIERGVAAVRSR